MKISWTPQPQPWVNNKLPTGLAAAEAAANAAAAAAQQQALAVEHGRHRHGARQALLVYGDDVDRHTQPDMAQGVFVDKALNLRARALMIDGEAYLAFRGTVGLFGLSVNWRRVNLRSGWVAEPRQHAGFSKAWAALRPQVLAWLAAHRPTAVNITGHSMGAAVAQLAAFDLCEAWPVQQVILFATPMVGGAAFNQAYADKCIGTTPRTLHQATQRYLMLSDAISIPLPRLLGYEPGLPILCFDLKGLVASKVPSLLSQAVDQVLSQGPAPSAVTWMGAAQTTQLGNPNPIEQQMGTFRMMALANGSVLGWLALAGLALGNVLHRAVGFHAMEGYARALNALPPSIER